VLSTVKLANRAQGLFIEGNFLAVFGTAYQPNVHTYIYIYNVQNRSNPRLVKTFTVEGSYFEGRLSKETGYMYILTRHHFNINDADGQPLPYYNEGRGNQVIPIENIFVYPGDYYNPTFINIASVNMRNPLGTRRTDPFNVISVVTEDAYNIYVSDFNIYLTFTNYDGAYTETVIHAVFIDRELMIPYTDGKVPGFIMNQFFMDEYNFDLRIATTQDLQIQPVLTAAVSQSLVA